MKNHHHNGPIHPTSRGVIHESIAIRAHELWERAGVPEGRAEEFWLEAEQELVTGNRAPKAVTAQPVES